MANLFPFSAEGDASKNQTIQMGRLFFIQCGNFLVYHFNYIIKCGRCQGVIFRISRLERMPSWFTRFLRMGLGLKFLPFQGILAYAPADPNSSKICVYWVPNDFGFTEAEAHFGWSVKGSVGERSFFVGERHCGIIVKILCSFVFSLDFSIVLW